MDMKKILQALDGASSKPVEGSNDMKTFMKIVEGKGPLNRLTSAESMAMQATATKKTITNPVLNVKEDAKPSMIGKYFKTIQEELLEAEERSKNRARSLAKRVIERVTIDPETGKASPSFADQMKASGAQPSPEPASSASMVGSQLVKAEKVDGLNTEQMTITVNGEALPAVKLGPEDPRPRGGQRIAIPYGMLGIRSIGNAIGVIAGGRVFILPQGQQESINEGYTFSDIIEMARLGFTNEEIQTKVGFNLSEKCWDTHKQVGMKKKGNHMVPNCVPKEDMDVDESGLQYYTGKKKYGADGMKALAAAGRKGANQQELGRIKDKYMKKDEAANPAQQAAIAISMKKAGKKPKNTP